ncbi:hypothetical protein Tco_0335113 [Tanacetum coccineum]
MGYSALTARDLDTMPGNAMNQSAEWLEDTMKEIDENRNWKHLQLQAKIQESHLRNQVDQNASECVDERVALANLIANLTLDTEENKTVLKQLKKANASLTQELKECKTNLDESSRVLGGGLLAVVIVFSDCTSDQTTELEKLALPLMKESV